MSDINLTIGERNLLIDGLTDDVAFVWILIDLAIRANPPLKPDWFPSDSELQHAFDSLRRLAEAGLIRMGRIEYIDGGSPGRLAPVRQVSEELDVIFSRVSDAVRNACDEDGWAFSCWTINTDLGDEVAHKILKNTQDT